MKQLLLAASAAALLASVAYAEDVKLGVELGFTGPLESIAPAMAAGAELAMAEVTGSGKLLGGATVTPVRGDSTCIDAAAASAVAERLITTEKVRAIIGADCSGVTTAILSNVALPNGVVMVSPSATSPALSTVEDNGLFFRTAPSDARQGEIVRDILKDHGVNAIAITFTNNDFGKGLADSIQKNWEAAGGSVTISAAHDDGKADYTSEVAALASAGGEVLVVAGYVDQGGSGVVLAALDTGAFDRFYFVDGMIGEKLNENFGGELDGSMGAYPGSDSPGTTKFLELAKAAGFDGTSQYAAESYDAAALILLAMQAAGSTDGSSFKDKIMEVANAPGTEIQPGELGKALELLAAGEDIDYAGASAVELIGAGESAGNYREIEFKDGRYETIGYR